MEGPEGKHWWDGLVKEYDGFFKINLEVDQAKGSQAWSCQQAFDDKECLQEEGSCNHERAKILSAKLHLWV
jgi:hypothetical protein